MIKYLKIREVLILFIAINLFSSCGKDFLEPKPTTSIENDEVFKSLTNTEVAMVGAYDQLANYQYDGLYNPIMSDITGEDVLINSEKNYNWFIPVYQLAVLPSHQYASNPWRKGYKVIYDANNIIHGANRVPDATEEEKSNIIAEAKVMRAYVMLKLVEMYAPAYTKDPDAPGILLVTSPLNYDAPDVGRSSVSDIYNQIVSDLTFGVNTLKDTPNPGFFGVRAAQALLARAYLDMQNWDKANEFAALARNGMDLMPYAELFSGFYSSNSETIFSLAYTPEDNNVYVTIPSFYWPVAGYSSMRADVKFVERFDQNDIRSYYFLKEDEIDDDNWLILKFKHNQQVGNAERISIRASEMYLIEAESNAELGNNSLAQDALFMVQNRAFPNSQKSINTGKELIDEILIERRKELFGEGFRWNDIKRRNLPLVREGDHWVKLNIQPNDEDYYRLTFPIPQKEIDANKSLSESDQNKGY